jgi:membrane protein
MAAAIGFYSLICIGPLGLLMAWALQMVMGTSSQSYEWLRYTVNRMAGEAAGAIMGEIDALITNPNSQIAGIFSALVLIWAGLRLFEALEISLTEIWPGQEERSLIARKLIALVAMITAGGLFIVAIMLTAFVPTVTRWLARLPMVEVDSIIFLQPSLRVGIEIVIAFAAFFLLFKYIPAQKVPTRVAAIGALFTAVAWRAVTPIFTVTVARSAEQSTIYGGLAGVVMFITWAFFGAHVLLLGAHLAAAYEHVVCLDRPESLDDSFIRMRPNMDDVLEADEEPDETFHGPKSYPPPGHV